MDFDRLPSEILLALLQRLPFKERIRIACVDRRFKDVSEMAISQMKAVCLTAPILRDANAKAMSKLFQMCAPNLKELTCEFPHPTQVQYRSTILKRLKILTKFSYTRVAVLKIDTEFISNAHVLQQLLASLPNLRAVEWKNPPSEFPKTICENLECATLHQTSIDFVASLAAYCPNVKHVFLDGFPNDDQDEHGLNGALAKWPTLETIELRHDGTMKLDNIDNLWKLSSLRNLVLGCGCYVAMGRVCTCGCRRFDRMIEKVSSAFPQLESLEIIRKDNDLYAIKEEMAVLKNLKRLRIFKLNWLTDPRGVTYYAGIDLHLEELVNCESLEIVELDGWYVRPALLMAFAHRCPKLRRLQVRNIDMLVCNVKSFVQSLDGFVQEDLTIHLTRANPQMWQSAEVQSVVSQIRMSTNRQLSFTVGRDDQSQNDNGSDRSNEWDKDPDCHREKPQQPVKPVKSFGQRFTNAMRDLPSKLFKTFK